MSRSLDPGTHEALAERLRFSLSQIRVKAGDDSLGFTVSVGAALSSECASLDYLDLVALADDRMYAAKRAGRDRVCFHGAAGQPRGTLGPPDVT